MKHSPVRLIIFPGHQLNNKLRETKGKHVSCSLDAGSVEIYTMDVQTTEHWCNRPPSAHCAVRVHILYFLSISKDSSHVSLHWGLAGKMERSPKLYTGSYEDGTLKAKTEGTLESRMQLVSLLHLKIPDSRINTIKYFFRNGRKRSRSLRGGAKSRLSRSMMLSV